MMKCKIHQSVISTALRTIKNRGQEKRKKRIAQDESDEVLPYPIEGRRIILNRNFILLPNIKVGNRVSRFNVFTSRNAYVSLPQHSVNVHDDTPLWTLRDIQIYTKSHQAPRGITHLCNAVNHCSGWKDLIHIIRTKMKPKSMFVDEEQEDGTRLYMFIILLDSDLRQLNLTESTNMLQSLQTDPHHDIWYTVDSYTEGDRISEMEKHKELFHRGTQMSYVSKVETPRSNVIIPDSGVMMALHVSLPSIQLETTSSTMLDEISKSPVFETVQRNMIFV